MSRKKTIDDVEVADRRVLMRADFNVPLDDAGTITDERRIVQALPTLRRLLEQGGRVVLMSHLGRPKPGDAEANRRFTLAPVARRLSEHLGFDVPLAADCVGDPARTAVERLEPGRACLLENLRFHAEETIKDKEAAGDPAKREAKDRFAAELAALGDVYVNDAFGTCHRDNASMVTVPAVMAREGKPRVIGYLVQKELEFLGRALKEPLRPFVTVLGGAKVSDKLGVIGALVPRCDHILVGGAMSFTFAVARGQRVGRSLVEPDFVDSVKKVLEQAGERIVLPVDVVAAPSLEAAGQATVVSGDLPDDLAGYDIGPSTRERFAEYIRSARTIFWNGPMGVFEVPPFDAGTVAIARAVADATEQGAVSIIGGGDSAAAVEVAGVSQRITHISTGGGASLEFLEGRPFPALEVIEEV